MTSPSPYGSDVARIGVTGALRFGAKGAVFPTLMSAWTSTFADAGWISDEGITENRDADTTPFVPWQSNSPIRVATTSETISWETVIWTTSFDTISLFYKVKAEDMVETDGVVSFVDGDIKDQDLRAFGIDIIDGVYARRFLVPLGEVTERGSQTYTKGELIGYPVTITAYPGAEGWSVKRLFKENWELPA
ncbi:hypothetical protein CH274_13205 [Rhodococcus sp. 06-418-5]|uniref:phage tail tube protein n=1 Tax=unclassified Rhodococcus (in: high G+C Gram-positive bacteria) TaxID=192944 RepID=UPI000B9B89EB|nr:MULTISPECIES: hypothetical protein [unclassified Rhodococcus (in: high G+C Gram-positive bacteria)]OZC80189.1 hypothetical protein CH274_13205 [Rhodococcus sp. 06-418-5]OZE35604.1 hypothetical protein CH259_16375 [Rhodococcus sp. 05-2254-4]OZE48033.1 hypothetical protein CH261_08970 [Rhodococcus sp. 05-2254-3]OZE49244.1 hypothetical protein CH283_16755 [Rhodococcus sp. 05-2254-2]